MMIQEQKMRMIGSQKMRVKDANRGPNIKQCEERFTQETINISQHFRDLRHFVLRSY